MRILYLHQYFVPPDGQGGTRSYEFARRLVAQGHKVCLITSNALMPQQYRLLSKTTHFDVEGISLVVIPVKYSNTMAFGQRIRAFLRFAVLASFHATRQQADVIFATSTPLTIAIPALIGRLWLRKPMVFEVRDLWPELPIAIGALKNPLFRWLARVLEWSAYHIAEHIIALSPGMKEGIIERGIHKEKVTVIPNSSDVELFDIPVPTPDLVRQKLDLSPQQPLVVYTGTFGLINNVSYIVRLAAETRIQDPDIFFLLVGDGLEFEKVRSEAQTLGVLDVNLAIWRSIPKCEIPRILATATAATSVFLPLKPMWNNSANKFFDALAAGKPVIINYRGWQAELLQQTGAGVVLPEDQFSDAAQQLVEFLRDRTLLQLASTAAHQLAYNDFNRDRLASELEEVLLRVVGEKTATT